MLSLLVSQVQVDDDETTEIVATTTSITMTLFCHSEHIKAFYFFSFVNNLFIQNVGRVLGRMTK